MVSVERSLKNRKASTLHVSGQNFFRDSASQKQRAMLRCSLGDSVESELPRSAPIGLAVFCACQLEKQDFYSLFQGLKYRDGDTE